jgi:hypothetical protein
MAIVSPGGKRPGTGEVDYLAWISREPSPHIFDGTKPQIRPKWSTQ